MADSILAQTLTKFTNPQAEGIDPVYRHPFTTTVNGFVWAVAVTEPTFVAVKGKASYPLFEGNDEVANLVTFQPDKSEEVDLAELKAWCGTNPERDEAVINGYVFDRSKLGRLIAPCPFPKVRLGTGYVGKTHAAIVEAPGKWRVVLGGIDCDAEPEMPVWGRTPEKQMFDLMMALE